LAQDFGSHVVAARRSATTCSMIYLCQPCKLASQACGAACGGMQQCCGESCKTISECCRGVCNIFSSITQYPLGNYVMGTWAFMILVIAASGATVGKIAGGTSSYGINGTTIELGGVSDNCTAAQMFCFINIAFAFVHFVMAWYIQWRIKQKVNEDMGGDSRDDKIQGVDIPHATIAAAAQHIALYDIGFCLYFFLFFGIFGYNIYGIGDVADCTDAGSGWVGATIMICYTLGAGNYFFCWFCMQMCCGTKEKMKKKGGGPDAETVGAA